MSVKTDHNTPEIAMNRTIPSESTNSDRTPAAKKWVAFCELLIVALIFLADERHLIPFSKTPFLLVLGWISLRLRGMRWRAVGLELYRNRKTTLAVGLSAGVVLELFQLFVSQPILVKWLGKQPDLEVFNQVRGNFVVLLIFLALTWTLAAFGEEMVYRGYLMNRVADLLNRTPRAWIISLIAVHVGFGLAHAYQGVTGIIDEGLMGFLLGITYLRTGRNLAVPILPHGIQDSIDFLLIFLGKYPGM
ncbi:MAG TPA: type II CAAX endopeptidase family protein [Blastocatellia bacterium]|nr:type II CAAX endopeptidase family protein [Blastocatellia bacterium]